MPINIYSVMYRVYIIIFIIVVQCSLQINTDKSKQKAEPSALPFGIREWDAGLTDKTRSADMYKPHYGNGAPAMFIFQLWTILGGKHCLRPIPILGVAHILEQVDIHLILNRRRNKVRFILPLQSFVRILEEFLSKKQVAPGFQIV